MNSQDAKTPRSDSENERSVSGLSASSVSPSRGRTIDRRALAPDRVVIPAEIDNRARIAVDAALTVHRELGPGLLESAYESCFLHELGLRQVRCRSQVPVPLVYKGMELPAGFRADVVLEDKLLIELKAVGEVLSIHKAQVITYLKILKLPLGLLINFNETLIKNGMQRVLNFS